MTNNVVYLASPPPNNNSNVTEILITVNNKIMFELRQVGKNDFILYDYGVQSLKPEDFIYRGTYELMCMQQAYLMKKYL